MSDEKSLAIRQEWESLLIPEATKMLGSDKAAEQFVRVIMTAFNKTPALMKCSRPSLMAAVMDLAALQLFPNTPQQHAFLIPRKVKVGDEHVLTCCVEIGYRGYCELAYRGGLVADIDGNVIRACDEIEYREGTDGYVNFKRQLGSGRNNSPVIGCYVVVVMKSGVKHVKVLDADQLDAFEKAMLRANFNKSTPAWTFFKDEMYLKSTLKRVGKLLPLGDYVQKAIEIERRIEDTNPMSLMLEKKPHVLTFEDTHTEKGSGSNAKGDAPSEKRAKRVNPASEDAHSSPVTRDRRLADAGASAATLDLATQTDAPSAAPNSIPEQRDARGDYLW